MATMADNLTSHPEGLFRTTVSILIVVQKQETGGETAEPGDRLGYWLARWPRNRFSIFGRGKILFSKASRPAPGPNQPPTQRELGDFFLGVKRPGREAEKSVCYWC